MQLPPEAYVDRVKRFAIVLPRGWRVIDPANEEIYKSSSPEWKVGVVLTRDLRQAVIVSVRERPWSLPEDARGIAEIERWLRSRWEVHASVEMETEITEIDGRPAFHTSMLATFPGGQPVSVDKRVVSLVTHSYAIGVALHGHSRREAAEETLTIAKGFRLLRWTDEPRSRRRDAPTERSVCMVSNIYG